MRPQVDSLDVLYHGKVDDKSHGGAVYHFVGLADALGDRCDVGLVYPHYRQSGRVPTANSSVRHYPIPLGKKNSFNALLFEVRSAFRFLIGRGGRVGGTARPILLSRLAVLGLPVVAARVRGFKVAVEVNGWHEHEFRARGWPKWAQRLVRATTKMQLRLAHSIICVSAGLGREVSRSTGVRVNVIPNGVDIKAYEESEPAFGPALCRFLNPDVDPLRLVYAGSLVPGWHDLDTVLGALASWSGTWGMQLNIFGEGEDRGRLENLCSELGLSDRVVWHGWLPRENLAPMLSNCDVGLVPLRLKGGGDTYGSPLKLFEYLAAGLRVLATNTDGVRELPEEYLRWSYDVGDSAKCASVLEECVLADPRKSEDIVSLRNSISWSARAQDVERAIGLSP